MFIKYQTPLKGVYFMRRQIMEYKTLIIIQIQSPSVTTSTVEFGQLIGLILI
jgi:hypothetical protein